MYIANRGIHAYADMHIAKEGVIHEDVHTVSILEMCKKT